MATLHKAGCDALGVADAIVALHGAEGLITDMKLNKLVYFAYAEALRDGVRLFGDEIQAWRHGPVVPAVYQEFKRWGRERIASPSGKGLRTGLCDEAAALAWGRYGFMTASDLRNFSHRPGGAWDAVRRDGRERITDADIRNSSDGIDDPGGFATLSSASRGIVSRWSEAFERLADS